MAASSFVCSTVITTNTVSSREANVYRERKRSLLVFDGDGRFVTAMLRPAKRPSGKEIAKFLRRLLRAIRANWPSTQILIRADSHYCCPEVIDFCRANGLDFGVAPTTTLRGHIEALEQSTKANVYRERQALS